MKEITELIELLQNRLTIETPPTIFSKFDLKLNNDFIQHFINTVYPYKFFIIQDKMFSQQLIKINVQTCRLMKVETHKSNYHILSMFSMYLASLIINMPEQQNDMLMLSRLADQFKKYYKTINK